MNVRPSALIIQDNKVLTLRYCYGDSEVYALPGGNPDPGECLSEALSRELHEELGIKAKVSGMICSGEVIWPEIKKETLHMVFQAEIASGTPVLNPEETTALEIVWLPINELVSKQLYPNVGTQIQAYLDKSWAPAHIGTLVQPYVS
ncbi:NUDIX domain-containing protein [Dyadobacter luticola]|uniref:NUDIX hydrolase n=1 Tax=Dyadobacter luticola TaxID=1979387 RepID=A0A5R9KUP7_9BACT|nr:NUDIX hydrolase [Dyadobacter luticola]TLV00013.1 NUDIX hydrolase [Dyadobacter luticola]